MLRICPRCEKEKQVMLRQNICFDCFGEMTGKKRAIRQANKPARKPLTDEEQKAVVAKAGSLLTLFAHVVINAFVSSANKAIDNKTLSSEFIGESEQ